MDGKAPFPVLRRPTAARPLGIVRALSARAKLPDLKIPN